MLLFRRKQWVPSRNTRKAHSAALVGSTEILDFDAGSPSGSSTAVSEFKPSVITSNLSRNQFEEAVGTPLYDRFRRASFGLLEFGFESKRPTLNADYLRRSSA
jgi:hypothetical protein